MTKMRKILNNSTKFELFELGKDKYFKFYILNLDKETETFWKIWKKKRFWRMITTILPRGFRPFILHCLTKLHKSVTDLCPSLQPIPFSNKHTIILTSKLFCSSSNTSNPKWFLLAEEVQAFLILHNTWLVVTWSCYLLIFH